MARPFTRRDGQPHLIRSALIWCAALVVCGLLGLLAIRFLDWRASKMALLVPPAAISSPAVSAAAAPPAASPPVLLLFGDSRVAQWQPLPARPYQIAVAGFPGETAIRLAAHLPDAIARTRPAMVMLQLGVNDAVAAAVVGPARRRQALADSLAAIDRMAADTRAAGAGLIILKVLPAVRPDLLRRLVYGSRLDTYVRELNAALPAIAARHGAALVDPLPLLTDDSGHVPDRYRHDTLHLTPAAYTSLAPLFPPSLKAPG